MGEVGRRSLYMVVRKGGWIESELGFQQKITFFSPEAMKKPVTFGGESFFPRTQTNVA